MQKKSDATKGKNMKNPTRQDVLNFTSAAWESIIEECIRNAFLKSEITFVESFFEVEEEMADFTLVVFSLEQLLCELNPFRYLNVFTLKRTLYTELVIIVLNLLWNYPYLVIFNQKQQVSSPSLHTWNATMTKVDIISCVSIWVTLLVTIILLTKAMAKHARARQRMVSESQHGSASNSSKGRTNSILLLCSAIIYSVTQFPFLVYHLLRMAEEPPYCWINIPQKAVALALVFGENLSILGYAIDFFVCYLSSTGFRRQVRSLIAGSKTNGQGASFSSSDCDGNRPLQSQRLSGELHCQDNGSPVFLLRLTIVTCGLKFIRCILFHFLSNCISFPRGD
ncbi:hypothetical protein BV898_14765 [Hypsibius exemplaris]|uniref:G-protein coupled receptors family 1 profile domain-containing protein n=1 Tax=Hypsibius exemplaris TaxID=2072580 RepID=A0A9X6RJT2_HYPEX|nr:hypothetical protein BV898_14765 [Hypsibius exemplaris]